MGEKKKVSSVRFLGILKQPDSDTDTAPELDEIWPSDSDGEEDPPPAGPTYFLDPDPEPEPEFEPLVVFPSSSRFGLSALLAEEDRNAAVRRPTRPVRARIGRGSGPGPEIVARSAPMNVPTWRHARREADVYGGDGDDVEEEEEEMVPPHVIVARSHVTTFSVFEGVGRTLKGRDLRRVRNAVFQKTGFLD